MNPPKHHRALLKLSGEALTDSSSLQPLNLEAVEVIACQVAEGFEKGVQVGVVIGAGNLWRGARLQGKSLERTASDTVGMLGTVMNSIVFGQILTALGVPTRVLSSIGPCPLVERYEIAVAREALSSGQVVICAGGTSNPYFTTDSAAALRALELETAVLLKATNVDGVYSADPNEDSTAKIYSHLTFDEVIAKQLRIMDTAAFSLCAEGNIPIFVFNHERPRGIIEAILGEGPGTRIERKG